MDLETRMLYQLAESDDISANQTPFQNEFLTYLSTQYYNAVRELRKPGGILYPGLSMKEIEEAFRQAELNTPVKGVAD